MAKQQQEQADSKITVKVLDPNSPAGRVAAAKSLIAQARTTLRELYNETYANTVRALAETYGADDATFIGAHSIAQRIVGDPREFAGR